MSQTPVSVKLALPAKSGFICRPGVVQVLQTQPVLGGQTIVQQRPQALKPFTTIRPLIPTVTGTQVNTNTAIQYVRKPAEMMMLGGGGTYIAASIGQSFTPFGGTMVNLNQGMTPNIHNGAQGMVGASGGQVTGLTASSGVLSNMANSRKPCNCTKSHCLKLYCECFAQGQLCQNCNCNNCMNNLAYEDERGRAIKMTLERNPTAFHPKIGRGEGERKHTKGCNCKRSGCLKNYCECYEAKISCSDLCRCQGCRNTEDSVERRSLMRLAAMGALRSRQPASFKKHLMKPPAETLPHVFFTWEVIEATTSCLLSQADDAERRDLPPAAQERIILEEFGHTLLRVIDSASKAQVKSASGLHTSASLDENDAVLMHGGGGKGLVGAADAAAAAADVLRDDDDDDEMMAGVDDDEDDDMYDDDDMNIRSHNQRRMMIGQRAAAHMIPPQMDDDMMSDEDPVIHGSSGRHGIMRYSDVRRTNSSHHTRRSHRHQDPDSII